MSGLVRSTIGDPDLRSPSGFDSGLYPPLRMTQGGIVWQRKLEITLDLLGGSVILRLEFAPEFRRYFFSLKLIKKPSPVGEGGSRRLTDEVSGISKFFPRTPHPPLPWSPFSHRRRLFY